MRSNSLFGLVFASILVAASAATATAQTTYTLVPPAPASLSPATPVESNSATSRSKPAKPEVTTFAPSNETLSTTSYQSMFRVDAFTALNQILAIESRLAHKTLADDESSLFQDIRDGHGDHFSFAEAALIASGVHDAAKRQKYLAQIDEITAGAKSEVAKHKTLKSKAQAIVKYLLDGPMKTGYGEEQFRLSDLLDSGHYNCVSSALLFSIVCHRLDIPVATVTQPGHVFSRIPGYDVQPTAGYLKKSETRIAEVHRMMKENDIKLGDYDADRPYHETGDFGLLGCVYNSVSVNETADNKLDQSAIDALKRACLDPTQPGSGHTLELILEVWCHRSTASHDSATARAIAKLYGQISRNTSIAEELAKSVANAGAQLASR